MGVLGYGFDGGFDEVTEDAWIALEVELIAAV